MARAPRIDTGAAKAFGSRTKVSIDINVTGLQEAMRKFQNFPPKLQQKIERKALRQAARIVANQMKARVPVDKGDMKGTIGVRAPKRSRKNKDTLVMRAMTLPAKLEAIGLKNPHWIEYGAPGHQYFGHGNSPLPPRPFARPAADASRGLCATVFQVGIRRGVDEICKEGD